MWGAYASIAWVFAVCAETLVAALSCISAEHSAVGTRGFVLMPIIVTSPVHASVNAYGRYTRRKGPSGVTVKAVLTTSGLSECLISMFALLLKASFLNFIQIACGYFHAPVVYISGSIR